MTTQTMPGPTSTAAAGVEPFTICISPFVIEDLRERLGRARYPDEVEGSGWNYGVDRAYLEQLCTHWGHGFDWKLQEDELNTFHHFCTKVDGSAIHFIHEQGQGKQRIPILLLHGWPDSFVRFLQLIPLLTAQRGDGVSFDVVVPSLPGFGFSEKPSKPGMNSTRMAELMAGLMEKLGYDRYMVHGGDWGSAVAENMAIQHPKRVMGIHLTQVPYKRRPQLEEKRMTPAEKDYLQRGQKWAMEEGAYGMLQSTKPQTLAYAINDSPIGLAAWIVEKFYTWTGRPVNLDEVISRDLLLMNLTIYWATQTAGSSFRPYYEEMHSAQARAGVGAPAQAGHGDSGRAGHGVSAGEGHGVSEGGDPDRTGKPAVPTAICLAPNDLVNAPREYADRFFNIRQWTQLPEGGHFVAMEKPELVAADIFRFAEIVGK